MNEPADIPLRARLGALAAYLPLLESPGTELCEVVGGVQDDGDIHLPYWGMTDTGCEFHHMLYSTGWVIAFDWPEWAATPEGRRFRDDRAALDDATPEQLQRFFTAVVRQERFCEGTFEGFFKNGAFARAARRAQALLATLA